MNDIKTESLWLMKGDCLERMKEIESGSVDLILTDPPYGTTACKWDSVIDLPLMWEQLKRIIKPNGAIVMAAAQPFTSVLITSNLRMFHHQWVWDKKFAANFPQAKRQPLRVHEDIVVFGNVPKYYPQMLKRDVPIKKGANKGARVFGGVSGLGREDYEGKVYDEKYPDTILKFSSRDEKRGLHPTQKPVALMEYLIKTYTNENETVLDFTFGSGTTGVACMNTNRKFIGVERDDNYFDIGSKRITSAGEV